MTFEERSIVWSHLKTVQKIEKRKILILTFEKNSFLLEMTYFSNLLA
jgi:hypothetical protein